MEVAIRTGAFRQDLYFRLNVVQMKLPALRERKSDIPLLVTSFLEKFSRMHHSTRTISNQAMSSLIAYDWPENIRELENAIERAVALSAQSVLEVGDLPSNFHSSRGSHLPSPAEIMALQDLERRAIFRTLHETTGDKVAAARILGIGQTTLYRKLKRYNETSVEA